MEDMGKENHWENKKSGFFSGTSDDMSSENPWAPPEEVGIVHGIARGLKSGLTQDLPSAAGKALQFVGAEEAWKSLTAFAEQNAVPEDQQGFWEKGARAIGAVLPMILAGAVGNVAGVVAGVAGGAIFGL